MSKSSGSFRVLVVLVAFFAITALLVNTYALDLSGPWGSSQNGLEMSSTSLRPSIVTIGTCDTAGPIEVESSGGTTTPTAYGTLKLAFDAILAGYSYRVDSNRGLWKHDGDGHRCDWMRVVLVRRRSRI